MIRKICKVVIYCAFIFNLPILKAQPTITVIADLKFPDRIPNTTESVTVSPQDANAALLRASGGPPNAAVKCIVEKKFINITNQTPGSGNKKIRVDQWQVQCPGQFDQAGNMDIRLGATASKLASDPPGVYSDAPGDQVLTLEY